MNIESNIWDKLTRAAIILIVIAVLAALAMWSLPLIRQNQRMRQEALRLETQIKKEAEANKKAKLSIESGNDPKTIDRLARQQLGYAKPGEQVIRFEEVPTNGATGR